MDDVNGRQFHSRRMEGAELGVNLGSLGRKETHQGILPTAGVYRASGPGTAPGKGMVSVNVRKSMTRKQKISPKK